MELANGLDTANTIVGLWTLAVATGAYLIRPVLERRPARRMLRISGGGRLDVIASTSACQAHSSDDAAAYLTAVGEVRGMAAVSRTFSRYFRKTTITMHMSMEGQPAQDSDLLLLGGPRRNERTKNFIETFNRTYPEAKVRIDTGTRTVAIGGREISGFDQRTTHNGVPTEDVGLIVVGPRDAGNKDRRVFLCAGLSTYGTEAAARFLFEELARSGRTESITQWLRSARRHRTYRRLLRSEAAGLVIRCSIDGRAISSIDVFDQAHVWRKGQVAVAESRGGSAPPLVPAIGDDDLDDLDDLDAELLKRVFVEAMPPAFIKAFPKGRHVLESRALKDLEHDRSPIGPERLKAIRSDHASGDQHTLEEGDWLQLEFCNTWSAGRPRLILSRKKRIEYADRVYVAGWYVPIEITPPTGTTITIREDAQQAVFQLAEVSDGQGLTVHVGGAVYK